MSILFYYSCTPNYFTNDFTNDVAIDFSFLFFTMSDISPLVLVKSSSDGKFEFRSGLTYFIITVLYGNFKGDLRMGLASFCL